MASTLIIGIGTTGLNIIEEAQQWHYEFTGRNKPDGEVEFLFLETDTKASPKTTPLGTTDIKSIYIDLTRHDATINALRAETDVENNWVPDVAEILFAGDGAGGMPSYGRLALWDKSNFAQVNAAIDEAYKRINGNSNTKIIIVGTLTGGTGAGLCVDISYLTRKITNNDNVEGIFLLPDLAKGFSNEDSAKLYLNTFSALAAIDYYTNKKNVYNVKWANSFGTVTSKHPPYKYIQYLSTDFYNANSSFEFDELLRLAGLTLLVNFIDSDLPNVTQLKDFINAKRVDGYQHHNTVGMRMIQYPVRQMEELFALTESKKIMHRWIDKTHYVDHGIEKQISAIENVISIETSKDIENIIEQAFEVFKSVKGPDNILLKENIIQNIDRIRTKNTGNLSTTTYIYSLFSTEINSSYFHVFKNNSYLLRDSIIHQVIEYIDSKTETYENLEISKKFLKAIVDNIKILLDFYKQNYKIQLNDSPWDGRLKDYISMLLASKSQYILLNQKNEFYSYLFNELISFLSIYTLIFELDKIAEAIENGISLKTIKKLELPTYKQLNTFIDIVTKAINSDTTGTKSISTRTQQIESVLNKKPKSIFYVYNYDNWQSDLKKAEETYSAMPNKIKAQDITITSIFNYINKIRQTSNADLYSTFVGKMVREINARSLFSNIDITNIIQSLDNKTKSNVELKKFFNANYQEIRKDLIPFVRIKSTDQFVVASNALLYVFHDKKFDNNVGVLPNCQPAPLKHAYVDTPSFKDVIMYYQEYGYMGSTNDVTSYYNPLVNNSFIEETKKHISRTFNASIKMKHVPYISEKEFKTNYLK